MLEIVVTSLVCIIDFILMIIFVKDYSDIVLLFQIFSFISLFIFYMFRYKKKYISYKVILASFLIFIVSAILMYVLLKSEKYTLGTDINVLGSILGIIFFYIIDALYIVILLLMNLLKFIVNKIKKV
jgi:hypothetical protein